MPRSDFSFAHSRLRTGLLVATLTLSVSASAQQTHKPPLKPPPPPKTEVAPEVRAGALKAEGDKALDEKRYEDALRAYDAALALGPNLPVLYNRGRALQFLARYAEALEPIETFARDAPPDLRARVPGLPTLLADLRARVTQLTVRCTTAGARVLLDQKQVGTCPMPPDLQVNGGKRVLEAFAEGHFPFRRELDLPGGRRVAVDINLTSREQNALLVVKSAVPGAMVSVDGETVGAAPAEAGVAPGPHRVDVDKDGFESVSTQVVLQRGERKEVSLDPREKPSILTRWWFWTGAAVVVAGAVTMVVVLSTERPAGSGDFSPGRVTF